MPMLIHVDCPNCSEPYDIADTFAGGVYRCTKCNTLMSVPKPHTPPAATRLAPGMGKAASPDEMERRGSSAPSRASSSTGAGSSKSNARKAPDKKTAAKPAAKTPGKTPTKGKTVEKSLLETYKWHLISFGAMLIIALVVIVGAKSCKKKTETNVIKTTVGARVESVYAFTYAKGVLTNDKPNVLGLPLTGNVAVIIDGGSELNAIRPMLHKLLVAGLTKPYDKPEASIVYANGDSEDKVPALDHIVGNTPDAGKKMDGFFTSVKLNNAKTADAVTTLTPAIQRALKDINKNQTRHLVLIVGRNLTSYAQNNLISALEGSMATSARVDLVLVNGDETAMTDLTDQISRSHGKTVSTTSTAIQSAAAGVK